MIGALIHCRSVQILYLDRYDARGVNRRQRLEWAQREEVGFLSICVCAIQRYDIDLPNT